MTVQYNHGKEEDQQVGVYIDFISLNRTCLKDYFPLLKIDQLVDSTSGHARMSFLYAYRGYHQIAMHEQDQEKTAFITPPQRVLLQSHALWANKRRCHILENDHQNIRTNHG